MTKDIGSDERFAELKLYMSHILGLWPGRHVRVIAVHPYEPKEMNGFTDSDVLLVIDEGRRQNDYQLKHLESVRGRAQFLLTSALALMALVFPLLSDAAAACNSVTRIIGMTTTILALLFFVVGSLGAASVIVAKKSIAMTDTAELSSMTGFSPRKLAHEYAIYAKVNENTRTASITVFRDAVLLILGGCVLWGVSWLVIAPS